MASDGLIRVADRAFWILFAALIVSSFGASLVQTSFGSSASMSRRAATTEGYGVFAVVEYAADTPNINYIDKSRIGATGHSARGNAAIRGASYFGRKAQRTGRPSKLYSVFGIDNALSGRDQIWYWKELLGLISLIVSLVMLVPLARVLLQIPYFGSLVNPVPAPNGRGRILFWTLFATGALIACVS
jgi:hypothetical protein